MKYKEIAIMPEIKFNPEIEANPDMKIDMDHAPCIFRLEKYVSVHRQNSDPRVSKEVVKGKLIDEITGYILSNLKIEQDYDLYSNMYVWRGELFCYLYNDEKENELTDKIMKLEHELENKKREVVRLEDKLFAVENELTECQEELNKPWWRRLFS